MSNHNILIKDILNNLEYLKTAPIDYLKKKTDILREYLTRVKQYIENNKEITKQLVSPYNEVLQRLKKEGFKSR